MHLWKECPMLKTCEFCKQVVEISEYNLHLLTECKESHLFSKCPRCQGAILNEDFDEHTTDMDCRVLKLDNRFIRCPLCEKDLPINEEDPDVAWREHLVDEGCSNNDKTN